ncbi:monovalent cation:proton antiporter family protein [Sporohalobacter salinus]|uniref:monovalent cation:proton antiporter family protein n=1 Tax=Sporohalobacter salinus TaxID=1494606 RepID=UPI00195FE64A|nr:cation:proton antiporter [Sporohalobacter salinus]MBM7625062.1 Kef-type K+ transport system membrane component KefB/Trk K+ transport system NAD-binding subunit [Sporohalobacter salinus]
MESQFSFNSLLIIIVLAFFVPILIEKIKKPKIPVVVGEILIGVIIGKSGFGLISPDSMLEFLSEFGFAFLMFLSGLEIDFDLIKEAANKRNEENDSFGGPVLNSILLFGLTLVLAFLISKLFVMAGFINNPWLMTLIISTTSLAIVMPTLKEKEIINTDYGQQILISSLLADFLTILMITIFVILMSSGSPYKILLITILFVAFLFFHKMGLILKNNKIFDELAHATAQIKVRASFALIMIFIALAEQLGIEIILGAFLAGVIISLISSGGNNHLNHKLDAIGYGFFIPIFFIMVGVKLNIGTMLASKTIWLFTFGLIIASYIVKLIPALLFKFDYSWKETIGAGFLLSSRLSLIIAASAIGLELGLISESINSAIILTAIFTCTISPILFDYFYPEYNKKVEKIIISGNGELPSLLVQRLNNDHEADIVIIEQSESKMGEAEELASEVVVGDVTKMSTLKKANLDQATTFLAATDDDRINEEVCKTVNQKFNVDNILALNTDMINKEELLEKGIQVITPSLATVSLLDHLIKHPKVYNIFTEEEIVVEEVILKQKSYEGNKVSELDLFGECLVLSIERDNEFIIPHSYNRLRYGDVLTLVGDQKCIKKTVDRLKAG